MTTAQKERMAVRRSQRLSLVSGGGLEGDCADGDGVDGFDSVCADDPAGAVASDASGRVVEAMVEVYTCLVFEVAAVSVLVGGDRAHPI